MTESMINNRARAAQLIDFKGLKYGTCSPTDVDLAIEWKGETFVFCDLKYGNAALPLGQKIFLQNIVDGLTKAGKHAQAIIARHNTPVGVDVEAAKAVVCEFYTTDSGWDNLKEGWGVDRTVQYHLFIVHEGHKQRINNGKS